MVRNTPPANTANLAHNIGSRPGTTVSEARIIPVLYSPVISRTPKFNTPMASCAKNVPLRLVEVAVSPGPKPLGWLAATAANMAPRPIMSTTATSNV
jgi:hypothetical protein